MFLLYFVAGYFVTGLLMMMVGIILTWRWYLLTWASVRYCAEEGYMMLIYVPLIVYFCWTGKMDAMIEKYEASKKAALVD